MKIEKLTKIFDVFNKDKVVKKTEKIVRKDSISISDEAKLLAEVNKYKDVIKKLPDVRADKVEEIKAKLKDDSYMSQEVYKSVAEKLSEFLKI